MTLGGAMLDLQASPAPAREVSPWVTLAKSPQDNVCPSRIGAFLAVGGFLDRGLGGNRRTGAKRAMRQRDGSSTSRI